MSHFTPIATIRNINEKQLRELEKKYGIGNVSLSSILSWNGEVISVESFEQIDKMNDDDEYAAKILEQSNSR